MNEFIIKDGQKFYHQKKLEFPKHDDYFVETGEVEFQGGYEPTGYFDEAGFQNDKKEHFKNCSKHCDDKAGYYCKNKKCNYPKCLSDK